MLGLCGVRLSPVDIGCILQRYACLIISNAKQFFQAIPCCILTDLHDGFC